jgi:DsbC/DsbD-like thiol-disulfide interchange protein
VPVADPLRYKEVCMTRKRLAAAVTVFIAAALLLVPAQAGGKKSDSEVKATVRADRPDSAGKQTIHLTLTINKGWYIYANPVGNDDFAANATTVTIKPKPQAVAIAYPEGKVKKDTVIGDYRIYEDKVTIPIQVSRAAGAAGPLELDVRVNACNAKMFCLPPGVIKVSVP